MCNWLTIIGASLAVVSALFALLGAIGHPHFSKKVEQEKEAQRAAVIAGLHGDIATERAKVARLEHEAAVIRTLGAELEVAFQGNWNENPLTVTEFSNQTSFYVYLKSSHTSDATIIKLHAAEPYELKEIHPGKGLFRAKQNVKIGQFPLGNQRDLLLSFDIVGIHIPFIKYKLLITPEILIEQVTLTFVLNGVSLNPVTLEQRVQAPVRLYGNDKSIAWASYEYPHVSIPWPQGGSEALATP
jgi:hypothetical protein